MNHALKAVVAAALGVGLAAAAQAQAINKPSTVQDRDAQTVATGGMQQGAAVNRHMSREQISEAQQQLKQQGLFKGRITGVLDHRTRLALSRFQTENGLPRTATLDQRTYNRLTGGQALGVGSSMPTGQKSLQNQPNTGATSMTPSTTAPTGAGSNNTLESTAPAKIGSPKQR